MPDFREFDQQQELMQEQLKKMLESHKVNLEDKAKIGAIYNQAATYQQWVEEIKAQPKVTLYLMVGVPGSGKTTYIRDHLPGVFRVCHDDLLKMMTGKWDIEYRQAYHLAEDTLVTTLLLNGFDVVIDRTLLDVDTRKRFIELAINCKARVVAIVMNTPLETAKQWNSNPDRIQAGHFVDEDVYQRLLGKSIPPELKEGFSEIRFVDPTLEGVRVNGS